MSARSDPQMPTPPMRTMSWPEPSSGSGQPSATRSDHGVSPRTTARNRFRLARQVAILQWMDLGDVEVLRERGLAGVRRGDEHVGQLHRGGDAAGVAGDLVVGELGGVGA